MFQSQGNNSGIFLLRLHRAGKTAKRNDSNMHLETEMTSVQSKFHHLLVYNEAQSFFWLRKIISTSLGCWKD